MLTEGQQKYLDLLPDDTRMAVKPWNRKGLDIANSIISQIHAVLPDLEVMLLGSVPLKIAGQQDIDISVFCSRDKQGTYIPTLERLFGKAAHTTPAAIGWDFQREGYIVSVWLTNPSAGTTQQQINIFHMLQKDNALLKEYERIKIDAKDLPYKEYQRRKYEFFNRVLGLNKT